MTNLYLYNFDFGKKVLYHPQKIADILQGKRPYPVNVEIDLSNICNHNCSFCNCAEFLKGNRDVLKTSRAKELLKELKKLGILAINWTGGGEPLTHKDLCDILAFSKKIGLRNGLITNGSLIKDSMVESLCRDLDWIRFSIGAGNRETYLKVHGKDHFDRVMANVKMLANYQKFNLNVGIKMIVVKSNIETVIDMVNVAINANADYLQLAPDQYEQDLDWWESEDVQSIFEEAKKLATKTGFKLLTAQYNDFREFIHVPQKCYGHFFTSVVNAGGNVAFCQYKRDDKDWYIGNINEQTFKEIYHSTGMDELERGTTPANCGTYCKKMAINLKLEELANPAHDLFVNFL